MRKIKRLHIPGWYFAATIMFAVFMYIWKDDSKATFLSLLGGIEKNEGEILILSMGKWLFLFGFFFLLTGLEVMKIKRLSCFVCYRHKTFRHWWKIQFFHLQLMVVLLYTVALVTWIGCALFEGEQIDNIGIIGLTFAIHLCFVITLEICFDMSLPKTITGGILIVVEGFLYILAEQYQMPWLAGGMYIRSNKMMESGFTLPVMYIVELLIILICYKMVQLLWEKGYMEEIQNGKNN